MACWCRQQRCLALSFGLSVVLVLFFCLKSDSSLFCTLFLDPFDLFYGIGTVSLHCLACSFLSSCSFFFFCVVSKKSILSSSSCGVDIYKLSWGFTNVLTSSTFSLFLVDVDSVSGRRIFSLLTFTHDVFDNERRISSTMLTAIST